MQDKYFAYIPVRYVQKLTHTTYSFVLNIKINITY